MPREDGQFKPGESGNPNGRPKSGESWADLIEEAMQELTDDESGNKVKVKKAIAQKMAKMALEGNPKFAEIIMERQEGKAKQTVDTNTSFTFNFEDETDAEI
jgi:hypothetical protein